MHLIIGLGNPGEKYQHHRHNVGFMFVDWLVKHQTSNIKHINNRVADWKLDKYSNSFVYNLHTTNYDLLLVKPQTYMNKSGDAVKKLTTHYNLQPTNLIVVHDELDLSLGDFKINKTGSPLHNGVSSIEKALKTTDFMRVRIGVDNRALDNRIDGETYVLSDFLPEEKAKLKETFPLIVKRLTPFM